ITADATASGAGVGHRQRPDRAVAAPTDGGRLLVAARGFLKLAGLVAEPGGAGDPEFLPDQCRHRDRRLHRRLEHDQQTVLTRSTLVRTARASSIKVLLRASAGRDWRLGG